MVTGTNATRRTAVWLLLLDGKWHTTMDVCAVNRGGPEGCRRLRELRKDIRAGKMDGYADIVKRPRSGSSQYEYKLLRENDNVDDQLALFDSESSLL